MDIFETKDRSHLRHLPFIRKNALSNTYTTLLLCITTTLIPIIRIMKIIIPHSVRVGIESGDTYKYTLLGCP